MYAGTNGHGAEEDLAVSHLCPVTGTMLMLLGMQVATVASLYFVQLEELILFHIIFLNSSNSIVIASS